MFHYRRVFISAHSCAHFAREDPSYGQRLTYAIMPLPATAKAMDPSHGTIDIPKRKTETVDFPCCSPNVYATLCYTTRFFETWNGMNGLGHLIFRLTTDIRDITPAGHHPAAVRRAARLARKGFK